MPVLKRIRYHSRTEKRATSVQAQHVTRAPGSTAASGSSAAHSSLAPVCSCHLRAERIRMHACSVNTMVWMPARPGLQLFWVLLGPFVVGKAIGWDVRMPG